MAGNINSNDVLVKVEGTVSGVAFQEVSTKELVLGESLLNPGLQTSITFQSYLYTQSFKNLDQLKNKQLNLTLTNQIGQTMSINQRVYRLDNRYSIPTNVARNEEFTIHACDDTLLNNAKSLVSKSWKCVTPDQVVRYVLETCCNAQNAEIDSCQPARDYIAENIHPFQVVAQQANVALDGEDPAFLHWMTFDNSNGSGPTHHFKSLKTLCNQPAKRTYFYNETGVAGNVDYNNNRLSPEASVIPAISFSFPCDFDLLSDILNGIDENGKIITTALTFLPQFAGFNMFTDTGNQIMSDGCGIGSGNVKQSMTSPKSSLDYGCNSDVDKYLLRRQAKMSLLERDKIALRIVVPWDPDVHAGDVIYFQWKNPTNGGDLYGFGSYLVSSMMHKIHAGGYATTTLDCVSTTTGQGIV